ncbi:MAG TPA: hypothetical protein VJ974_09205 [Geopsychrobacteraceae bacterium]|nr:hypothetical protein [Geopsychrobacteraceae bacterium]
MNRSQVSWFWGAPLLTIALLVFVSGNAVASSHQDGETTATDVKKEAVETYDTLKNYTVEQRDEAMKFAEEKLSKLDSRIEKLQGTLDRKWQNMSDASRKKTRQTLNQLKQQREKAAEWYGGMQHSSSEAWIEVKKGFADSYERLEKAFIEAKSHYENEKE